MQPHERQLKKQSNRIGWILTAMVGILFVSSFLIYGISNILSFTAGDNMRISVNAVTESLLYMCAFIIPAVLFYVLPHREAYPPIGFSLRITRYFPLVLFAFLAINLGLSVLNGLFCQAVGIVQEPEPMNKNMQNPEIILLYMTTSLAPAFAEEVLFRGVVYTNLRSYGKTLAVLMSSVLFGLMHMNTEQFLYTTTAGILLAMLYEMTGSIWSGVLVHMCNNLYSIFQTVISVRFPSAKGTAITYIIQASVIFLGAISIIALGSIYRKNASLEREVRSDTAPQGLFGKRPSMSPWQTVSTNGISLGRSVYVAIMTPGMIVFTVLALLMMIA
ncbi:MAG: CPBP family intramembrane metalloprotease [Clostridia bacterium]|nr:CPBP family intramembrane metalloprotease [Clostridia bacterium]